ncbi:MAG: hypothetical protein ACK2TV_14325 [Anaerolineales bacterium]
MQKLKSVSIFIALMILVNACQTTVTSKVSEPTLAETLPTRLHSRTDLTYNDLIHGFEPEGIINEDALRMPADASPSPHVFQGRLELLCESEQGKMRILRGSLSNAYEHLPEFDFSFVSYEAYLIPIQRGLIITNQSTYDIILEPGHIWMEDEDQGFSRASLPFALVFKGDNALLNGTLTFLFDGESVSKVWYQITQETTRNTRVNLWGLLDAVYHPESFPEANQVQETFKQELASRFPTFPIEKLQEDYPSLDLTAFGSGVTPEHMAWFGVIVDGINYLGGCQTRAGIYPYCEWMRQPSYSIAKSTFPALALMQLAQVYGPGMAEMLIKDYVPEAADSSGDWDNVTFNNTLDMATGNYDSDAFMVDDNSTKMYEFFGSTSYAEHIFNAFNWSNKALPGQVWVYRTSDTFIVTSAMQNYLQSQTGSDEDIFDFVVDQIYRPLGLGPGAFTTMRTSDNNWQGQAEGGYGLWWIPDDIAKLTTFLLIEGGKIDGEQVLHPGLLASTLQQDPGDRGMRIDTDRYYNNAFWAQRFGKEQGFECEFWVTDWQGVSGNVVLLMPNGVVYYYFSDNQEFVITPAVIAADRLHPFCP